MIDVKCTSGGDPLTFDVVVRQGGGETRHQVSLDRELAKRLSDDHAAEQIVEAAFRFLLDREPKESILTRFDLAVIARYFPEFEARLPDYLRL